MEKDEKIEKVLEAQTKLNEAIELLEEAVGDDPNINAYIIDHLKIMAGSGHGFVSRDENLDDVIAELDNPEEEDEEVDLEKEKKENRENLAREVENGNPQVL